MRRNSFLSFLKEKSFIIVLTLMLVSAGTMAVLFALGGDDQTEGNQVAQQEETNQEVPPVNETDTKEEDAGKKSDPSENQVVNRTTIIQKQTEGSAVNTDNAVAEAELEAELEDQYLEAEEMAEASASDVIAEEFSEADLLTLRWPVEGEVILEFSMDHSIYFPTLGQYQYNPAMIISAAEGTEVICAASGTVTDVGKSNEYGHYVTMDIGNGFEITYGQLFDITTEVGEVLEEGERFAMVALPTRSYVEEGDNLYLKLTKDGASVDPALYLEN